MGYTVTTTGSLYTWANSNFSWDSTDAAIAWEDTGQFYTWATATWSWNSVDAQSKTWAEAAIIDHELLVDTDISLAELVAKDVTKLVAESFGVSDASYRDFTKGVNETISFSETYADFIEWILGVAESISFTEVGSRNMILPRDESFGVSQTNNREITKNVLRDLTLGEAFSRTVDFNRQFDESLSFLENIAKNFDLNKAEAFALYEMYRRRANGVISDMIVDENVLTDSDFADYMDVGHAPGYSDFRDFIQGDYTYEKAIIRAILETQSTDRGFLTDLKHTADVPDVVDRGEGTITTASTGVTINFARDFSVTPEITVTHIGGSGVAIPRITTSSTTSFTVVLEDTSGSKTTGTISWIAQGY